MFIGFIWLLSKVFNKLLTNIVKKKITVGNIETYRDYSWAPEIAKSIFCITQSSSQDTILSSGNGISGREILKIAYKQNKLNYKNFYETKKKFYRKNEDNILIGSKNNTRLLIKKCRLKLNTYGPKLIKKMYKMA